MNGAFLKSKISFCASAVHNFQHCTTVTVFGLQNKKDEWITSRFSPRLMMWSYWGTWNREFIMYDHWILNSHSKSIILYVPIFLSCSVRVEDTGNILMASVGESLFFTYVRYNPKWEQSIWHNAGIGTTCLFIRKSQMKLVTTGYVVISPFFFEGPTSSIQWRDLTLRIKRWLLVRIDCGCRQIETTLAKSIEIKVWTNRKSE